MHISLLVIILSPLSIALAAFFAAILAHRGKATLATKILIASSSALMLFAILFAGLVCTLTFDLINYDSKYHRLYEHLYTTFPLLNSLSSLAYAYGIYSMGKEWKNFHNQLTSLEREAQELAANRDSNPIS